MNNSMGRPRIVRKRKSQFSNYKNQGNNIQKEKMPMSGIAWNKVGKAMARAKKVQQFEQFPCQHYKFAGFNNFFQPRSIFDFLNYLLNLLRLNYLPIIIFDFERQIQKFKSNATSVRLLTLLIYIFILISIQIFIESTLRKKSMLLKPIRKGGHSERISWPVKVLERRKGRTEVFEMKKVRNINFICRNRAKINIYLLIQNILKAAMNIPKRTRKDQQAQTDINLVGNQIGESAETQLAHRPHLFLEYVNESWMMPFSDYYLLSQLSTVIQQLKESGVIGQQYKTRKIIDDLTAKIYGLLARELKVTTKNTDFYEILLQKEKDLIRLQTRYKSYEKKFDESLRRIQELQREIKNLDLTLKSFQKAAEENEIYKSFFKDLKNLTVSSKKVTDFDQFLNEKIIPRMREFQINLEEVSKNAGRDRTNRVKAAISRYAHELDEMSKERVLTWERVSESVGVFFTSLEHTNDDDWIRRRLDLARDYDELRNRHVAFISLLSKNLNELMKKDATVEKMTEVFDLLKAIQNESRDGFETVIVNGWIGLGVIHCHRNQTGNDENFRILQELVLSFQKEFTKLLERYPQLNNDLSEDLRNNLFRRVGPEISENDGILKQIITRQTEVVHVDNVYQYYNKADKDRIFYLRVLVKYLVEELNRIGNDHKINIQIDEGILQLLKKQSLDGIDIEDVIALFRPSARVCEVQVAVDRPFFKVNTHTVGVPLAQEKAVVVADKTHFAVNLQQMVEYRKEIPYKYVEEKVREMATRVQIAIPVPTRVTEEIVKCEDNLKIVEVSVDRENYVEVIREDIKVFPETVIAYEQVPREIRIPYEVEKIKVEEVMVEKEVPKNVYKEINKIFKVEQTVPKVYKEPKFEIVERPVHHVVTQKEIQFVEIERPIIERHEIAKVVQVMVEKPILYPEHCDCQKPEAVTVEVEKPIYKEYPKEIIVEKCHFVQGNVQERIVEVPYHVQVPIFTQIIKEVPVIIEKPYALRTTEEKLVVVDRQTPFVIERFTPVPLIIEKPVIVRDIKHVPVNVSQPVPVYIDRIVPKIVEVFRDRIVQKIVEVPRIQIIEKIVEKIVIVPRIVERLVPVIQTIEVPVFMQIPCVELVEVRVPHVIQSVIEKEKIIEVNCEVLKIENKAEIVKEEKVVQVRTTIEIEPEAYPECIVEKLVQCVKENYQQIHVDRIVERVVHIKEIVPVEQRVEIPIEVQIPVEIISQKPIFYKQPVVQIDVQRVERDKIVELIVEAVEIKEIPTPYIQIEKEIVRLPGDTIILKEPELHIVEIEKADIVTVFSEKETPVQHYMDIQKVHVVDQQTFVVPEKEGCAIQKPYPISIEKVVPMKHREMVPVEKPDTIVVKSREGPKQQIVKMVTQDKLVVEREIYPEPIVVKPDNIYHILYEELPPKSYEKKIMVVDESVRTHQIQNKVQVPGSAVRIITKEVQYPVYMEKILEKILMLPQIVEIEKKVYMIEEINSLIAKDVLLETHYDDYRTHMLSVQDAAIEIVTMINQGKQGNAAEFKKKLNLFLELLKTESRMPKIVEKVKTVEVIKERDRPVLVPVYDSQREKVLYNIIADLLEGIKGLSKAQIERRFSERVRSLFAFEFGLGGSAILGEQAVEADKSLIQSKWKSLLDSLDGNMASTIPSESVRGSRGTESMFLISGSPSSGMDYEMIRASLQKLSLVHKQKLIEIQNLRSQYAQLNKQLSDNIRDKEIIIATERYYKDLYFSSLMKIKGLLQAREIDQMTTVIERTITIREQLQDGKRFGQQREMVYQEGRGSEEVRGEIHIEGQRGSSELILKLSDYENSANLFKEQIATLKRENERLRFEIDDIKLSIPVWNKETSDEGFNRYNEEWKEKIRVIEENHFLELNHLRDLLTKRLSGGATEDTGNQQSRMYDDLMKRYTQLSEIHSHCENGRRNLAGGYEDKLRDLNKELLTLRRDYESLQSRSENERRRIIDEYERKIASMEKQLRRQIDALKKNYEALEQRADGERKRLVDDYEKRMTLSASNQEKQLRKQLEQTRRTLELAEQKCKAEKKRIIDEYEAKLKSSGNQEKDLRKELENSKRNAELADEKCKAEKKRIIDEYERKLASISSSGTQDKELKKQYDGLKRNYESIQSNFETERKKLIDQYEAKLRSTGSSQERELKRELDTLKRNYQNYQRNTESQRQKLDEEYQRKIKQLQDDLQRARTARKGQAITPEQAENLQALKDRVKILEVELESAKREIESYQKSRLGQTTISSAASGIKPGTFESDFQSPQTGKYRSSGPKFEEGDEGMRKQEEVEVVERGRISKSGVRGQRGGRQQEEGEDIRSSSSRVSGTSQSSTFKSSMTMREFMDLKKAEDKDTIVTLVMIKVIEKIQEEADKGIVNSYSPSNIYLSNFNPNNLDSLIVRFGAPITNRKSKTDGLYLSPEVLRGEGTTLKSVVFTLAVIWDELIHYEIYYKTVADIENLAYEYKVRDTSLNPILRNTLFEMMSKDPSKRLELAEAKRRLSLQRYIVSEGRGGTATLSRVSTQTRRVEAEQGSRGPTQTRKGDSEQGSAPTDKRRRP